MTGRTLDRLVGGSFLRLFVLAIFATPPLFILGEVTENLDRYVDQGLTGFDVARGFLYRFPEYFVWSFPIAGLIAAVFTVHGMTHHHEVVAAKAGGISFHRLVAPILVIGAFLTLVALSATDLVPRSNRTAYRILRGEQPRQAWRADFVYQSAGGYAVSARQLRVEDRRLARPVVVRRADDGEPALHLEAREAVFDESAGWTFSDGFLRRIGAEGDEHAFRFERFRLAGLEERPEELLKDVPEDDEMTYAELGRMIDIIESSGGEPHKLRVKREQKLAIPVATFVIILFGTPLATSSKRGGAAFGVGIALGTTILYLLLLKVGAGFGASGAIPPWSAAWLPNLLFLAAGLVLMSRVRT